MSYVVYEHITPSGKIYVGLTGQADPNNRWENGKGYKYNLHFYRAIQKYGWENIEHRIVASNLTCEEACKLEKELIESLDTLDPMKGYNKVPGNDTLPVGFQWYTGLTKETCPTLRKISDALKGRKRSEEQKQNLRDAIRAKYDSGYSPMWINNGEVECTIDGSQNTIPDGWVRGRLPNKLYVFKDDTSLRITQDELSEYLSKGWTQGRPEHTCDSIRKSRRSHTYYYKGMKFETAEEVACYLRSHGYPKIVSSTITQMLRHNRSEKYVDILKDLTWVRNESVKVSKERKVDRETC